MLMMDDVLTDGEKRESALDIMVFFWREEKLELLASSCVLFSCLAFSSCGAKKGKRAHSTHKRLGDNQREEVP